MAEPSDLNAILPNLDLVRMTVGEKIELIGLLWDNIPEADIPTPELHIRVIEERVAEYHANPDEGWSWEEVKAEWSRESVGAVWTGSRESVVELSPELSGLCSRQKLNLIERIEDTFETKPPTVGR
jgi:putative addiction module component (TIGR02574 family)